MTGKVCVVTGANTGIGLETARELAEMNAHVILGCRDLVLGQAAIADLKSKSNDLNVELMLLDLASQESIRGFAGALRDKFDRLDVLVNNAATVPVERELTADGLEMQFGVNHIGPFLLTHLLLDLLKSGSSSRIVNVASNAHENARMNFDDLQSEQKYAFFRVYGQSKLANVLFSHELARRLEGSGVTSNCLHPGGVRTKILRNMRGPLGFVVKYGTFVLMSPRKGAKTSVYLASSREVEGVSGKYFVKCREVVSSERSRDEADAKRLWDVSEKLAGL